MVSTRTAESKLFPERHQLRVLSTRTGSGSGDSAKVSRRRTKSNDKEPSSGTAATSSGSSAKARTATTATVDPEPKATERKPRKTKTKALSQGDKIASAAAAATGHSLTADAKQRPSDRTPPEDLDALQTLVNRLTLTNSTLEKREILARHPDLAPLLAWIYDPLRQFHVSSSNILKYAQTTTGGEDNGNDNNDVVGTSVQYDTLPKLLSALSTRAITGHSALDAILHFMERFCQDDGSSSTDDASISGKKKSSKSASSMPLFSTPRSKLFLKILDKNLKTGCSVAMINGVYPDLISSFHVALGHSLSMTDARSLFGVDGSGPSNTKAKGRKNNTETDTAAGEGWFASRKLDGVRCLIRVDRSTGGIETLSRNGKGFESLESIQTALRKVMTRSNGHSQSSGSWDGFFARVMGLDPSDPKTADLLPEQLIFDGEMCAFLKEAEPEQKITANGDDGNREAVVIGGRGNDELGQEHFLKTVSLVKRGWSETDESEMVVYCIFDCLTDKEFMDRKGTRPFSERLQGVARALYEESEGEDDPSAKLLRILKQTKLKTFEQLEKMVAMGMERGWEGVMMRKDIGYEGKRSRNLLKIKQYQDAEFVVQGVMVGSMRLPLHGHFEERDNVLTNVVILHRGTKVRVGSGFSAEDRIRFGKDPSLIVGKTITVKYFEESKALTKDDNGSTANGGQDNKEEDDEDGQGGLWSLRFPTVKAIYEDGPRDI
ncbi:MAG: hypothetical protein J3Q66DRAFT_281275 [Benniella sp.]|nr:MAG: hypothetical protein J3Q66DRAFT_281275 [Benniella sp.]